MSERMEVGLGPISQDLMPYVDRLEVEGGNVAGGKEATCSSARFCQRQHLSKVPLLRQTYSSADSTTLMPFLASSLT